MEINRPDVDPSRGLVVLRANLIDASRQVAQGCRADATVAANELGKFTVTGRGGLPTSPNDTLNGEAVWQDLRPTAGEVTQDTGGEAQEERLTPLSSTELSPRTIVEAQGWVQLPDGQVVLTAQVPAATPQSSWLKPPACQMP